jgi:methylmalonyl-CoA/ethylmalonyl-CoA epimerase
MLTRLDHVGVVAHSLDEASQVLVARLGFELDLVRAPLPDGSYFAPERTQIFFIKIGVGETRIEILLPEDNKSGIGRWLQKRGPSMHHLCYASDNVPADAARLRNEGLEMIDLGADPETLSTCFFHPRSMNGILTEIITDREPSDG